VYARLSSGNLSASNYNANYQFGGHLRRNSAIKVYNSIFIGSRQEAIHFDRTNGAAVFTGNFLGRSGVTVSWAPTRATTGNPSGPDIDLTNFATNNFYATSAEQQAVNLSDLIAGLAASNIDIETTRLGLLAAGSSLLSGAKTVPAGLEQTDFIGAFDDTDDWTSAAWVNFNPNASQY
jgi:hypothetical protein